MVETKQRALLGFTSSGERSLEAAANKFLQQPGLRVLQRTAQRSGDLPAIAAVADGKMENGQTVRVLAYFVQYRDQIYNFVGYSSPEAFRTFENVFMRTMAGFSEIKDSRMLQRQPARLDLLRVDRAAPFKSFIPATLPPETKPEDVAILNQVTLTEEIRAGRTVKLPKP
jgi:predicted Zn-dependent protease